MRTSTSCHTVHSILLHKDPEFSTCIANLPETCGQCHEGANTNFAVGAVHIVPTDPNQQALGIVRLIYLFLIVAIIGGMVAHNTLMMGRHALTKFRQELAGKGTYRRFAPGMTYGHLVLTIAFIVLAVSGFALLFLQSFVELLLFLIVIFRLSWCAHRHLGLDCMERTAAREYETRFRLGDLDWLRPQ